MAIDQKDIGLSDVAGKTGHERGAPLKKDFLARFSIKTKLVFSVVLFLFITLSVMLFSVTYFSKKDSINREGIAQVRIMGSGVEQYINGILEEARSIAASVLFSDDERGSGDSAIKRVFFGKDSDFISLGIGVLKNDQIDIIDSFHNNSFLEENQFKGNIFKSISEHNSKDFKRSFNGSVVFINVSTQLKMPVLAFSFPYKKKNDNSSYILVSYIKMEKILDVFENTESTHSFMVNVHGDILAHSNKTFVLSNTSFATVSIVRQMLTSESESGRMDYVGKDNISYAGFYKRIPVWDLGIIIVEQEKANLTEINRMLRIYLYLMGIVLCFSALVIFIFARRFIKPVQKQIAILKQHLMDRGEESETTGGDEFVVLADLINRLISSYRDQQQAPVEMYREQPEEPGGDDEEEHAAGDGQDAVSSGEIRDEDYSPDAGPVEGIDIVGDTVVNNAGEDGVDEEPGIDAEEHDNQKRLPEQNDEEDIDSHDADMMENGSRSDDEVTEDSPGNDSVTGDPDEQVIVWDVDDESYETDTDAVVENSEEVSAGVPADVVEQVDVGNNELPEHTEKEIPEVSADEDDSMSVTDKVALDSKINDDLQNNK